MAHSEGGIKIRCARSTLPFMAVKRMSCWTQVVQDSSAAALQMQMRPLMDNKGLRVPDTYTLQVQATLGPWRIPIPAGVGFHSDNQVGWNDIPKCFVFISHDVCLSLATGKLTSIKYLLAY